MGLWCVFLRPRLDTLTGMACLFFVLIGFLDRIPFMYDGRRDLAQTRKGEIVAAIQEAQSAKRGIWSLGDQRVSAAEQKRILRGEGEDPAATYSF